MRMRKIDTNILYESDMNNLNKNELNILDIPDEIFFIIFKKLNMVEVLYSLVDVNRRFDRLAFDSLYINNLNMTDTMTINSFYEQPCSIDAQVISKISECTTVQKDLTCVLWRLPLRVFCYSGYKLAKFSIVIIEK
jgi:hypothetical protein